MKTVNVTPEEAQVYKQKASLAHWALSGCYIALLLCFGYWRGWVTPVEGANSLLLWVAQSSLLLAFLPVILRGQPRSYAWLCFALIPYFLFTVEAALNPNTQWVGALASCLVALLFCTAMFYARWQARYLRGRHSTA
ncbi:MAG: DUF2069 domain-containing protein [Pontibacterium sp.]